MVPHANEDQARKGAVPMKLASGDMLTFRLDACGCVLQCIGHDDVPRVEKEGRGWNDGDSVSLQGTDVAFLLYRLTTGADGVVVAEASGASRLRVTNTKASVVLKTRNNEVQLTAYERYMLVAALESQVWRLFQ